LIVNKQRLDAAEITVCGPMFGYKMMPTEGEPHQIEMALLEEFHLGINKFKRMKVTGTRRPFFIYPEKIEIE
jgi:tRNA(Glu) U13 pseudouridine synthase TruD